MQPSYLRAREDWGKWMLLVVTSYYSVVVDVPAGSAGVIFVTSSASVKYSWYCRGEDRFF